MGQPLLLIGTGRRNTKAVRAVCLQCFVSEVRQYKKIKPQLYVRIQYALRNIIMMKKRLNDLQKTGELCFLYYDEDDTEIFLIGTIEKVDREFFVMSCYTLNGEANGFTCRLIQSIIKIETKHAYIESVQKLIDGERHAAFPAEFREGMQCLTSILDYAYKNRRVCFIELCESSNVDAVGLIGELDRQTIMMYLCI